MWPEIRGMSSNLLEGKKIIMGVTGSIAAVETVKLCRELIRHGADVHAVMTKAACEIITPDALEFATGNPVISRLTGKVEHVRLCGETAEKADLLLIAPCTANTISKIACGIDDTPVTTMATTAIGTGIPLMIVPAMHSTMANNPLVIKNLDTLSEVGITVVSGATSEKKLKMPSTEIIVNEAIRLISLNSPDKKLNKKILVITGSTRESIDDFRCITNHSSGIMGKEISLLAYRLGADVSVWKDRGTEEIPVKDVRYFESVSDIMKLVDFDYLEYDVIIVCAAISDFTVDKFSTKLSSGGGHVINLMPTPKILSVLRNHFRGILVGFKASSGLSSAKAIDEAIARFNQHNLDMIVANDISVAGSHESNVTIISKSPPLFENNKGQSGSDCYNEENFVVHEGLMMLKFSGTKFLIASEMLKIIRGL